MTLLLLMISSCDKGSTGPIKNENLISNYDSKYLKSNLSSSDVKTLIVKNASLYEGKSVEYILADLVTKNIISSKSKADIVESLSGKSFEEFKKEALIRLYSNKPLSIYKPAHFSAFSDQIGEAPILNDQVAQQIFDYVMLDLEVRGISWGCAAAIAGYGFSIASVFIGGPVTIAAAVIWGGGHILSVLAFTACASRDQVIMATIAARDEEDFIDEFEQTYGMEEIPVPVPVL